MSATDVPLVVRHLTYALKQLSHLLIHTLFQWVQISSFDYYKALPNLLAIIRDCLIRLFDAVIRVMLAGKELGKAIAAAISKKIDSGHAKSKAEIARHFGVKAPSLQGWINTGAISKERLPTMWAYFSDVVGPTHWGLTPDSDYTFSSEGNCPNENIQNNGYWPFKFAQLSEFEQLDPKQQDELDRLIAWFLAGASKPRKSNSTEAA